MDNHPVQNPIIPTEATDLKTLPLLLDIETAKRIPGCSDRYIRKLCEDGTIRAVKMGRVWRVNRDSLLEFCGLA